MIWLLLLKMLGLATAACCVFALGRIYDAHCACEERADTLDYVMVLAVPFALGTCLLQAILDFFSFLEGTL